MSHSMENMKITLFLVLISILSVCVHSITTSRCPKTVTRSYDTPCTSCYVNYFIDCNDNTTKVTTGEGDNSCRYIDTYLHDERNGCFHTCQQTIIEEDQCCDGFWGQNCDECPRGMNTGSICNGHGACDDKINGTGSCTCNDGWTGYACELLNSTITPNQFLCSDVRCPNNSRCFGIDGGAKCVCDMPYADATDNETDCQKLDICSLPPTCHQNASCGVTDVYKVTGFHKICTCNTGFHGDGIQCDPVDPCQENYGGCDINSTTCAYVSPGKNECTCKDGYHEYVDDVGCSLVDICRVNASSCHAKAMCKTDSPNHVTCTCPDGYTGDGHVCFGNLLQTIEDLDETDPLLQGQMSLIKGAMEKYYRRELTEHGPFTIFVPTNEGFRTLKTGNYQNWLQDQNIVRLILRDHMLAGEFEMDRLANMSAFYTLQGTEAAVNVYWRATKYQIEGTNKKAKIEKSDIVASNGIIHVINKLLVNNAGVTSFPEDNIHSNIKKNGKYNRMESLIASLGDEISEILNRENMTVIAPINKAWDALPDGSMDFLLSEQGREHLIAILKNHIYEGVLEVTDIVNSPVMSSVADVSSYAVILDNGQIKINYDCAIILADNPASNGLIHDVDCVNVPVGFSTLPNFCNDKLYHTVNGPCDDCRVEPQCIEPDRKTNKTKVCEFSDIVNGDLITVSGCAAVCNVSTTWHKCCDGFYGYYCRPCPGGYRTPCNGHGKCDEGYYQAGSCECDENFAGTACQLCIDNHYGPNCTQECPCLHGTCIPGPEADGSCTCDDGYLGYHCDKSSVMCSTHVEHKFCHAHALCTFKEDIYDFRCQCKTGYEGNGVNCTDVNVCERDSRGGCDPQATCTMTGPGTANCTCNMGYSGDGKYCEVETVCSNHTDCHYMAQCRQTTPGRHICVCLEGMEGNGTYCQYKDRCEGGNGACDPQAICTHEDRSRHYVTCTCPADKGLSGTGYECHGDLLVEMLKLDRENFAYLHGLVQQFSESDRQSFTNNNYTLFVMNDNAIHNFMWKDQDHLNRSHWMRRDHFPVLLSYHAVPGSYKLDELVAISEFTNLDTLADGFSILVTRGNDGVAKVMPRKTGAVATVVKEDIITSNGYINIIDKVLEPYEPRDPDSFPVLTDFLEERPQYSIFTGWLKDKGVLTILENMNAYTLYVPNNEAASNINRTVTKDLLGSYIHPAITLMISRVNGTSEVGTVFGKKHKRRFIEAAPSKFTVNGIPVLKEDLYTYGGVINEIDGLFTPIFNDCDNTVFTADMGPCSDCRGTMYQCEGNAKPSTNPEPTIFSCQYTYKSATFDYETQDGCQGICYEEHMIKGCCDGYFGPNCTDCPGGPETPCNLHGTCRDGTAGDGFCMCLDKFTGVACETCIDGWAGDNCNIDMSSCAYQNGGCDKSATCSRSKLGDVSCTCLPGYSGDGLTCASPCVKNNTGCHDNATCSYNVSRGIACSCNAGLVGDGKHYCNSDIVSTLATLDTASMFYQSLQKMDKSFLALLTTNDTSRRNITMFVPVDRSINKILSSRSIRQQIVSGTAIVLHSVDFSNATVVSLSNNTLNIGYQANTHVFYVNDVKVLEGNIPCTNGIIHLVAAPFFKPVTIETETSSSTSGGLNIGIIVGPIVACLVVAILVAVGVMVYRSKTGYWQLLHVWMAKRQDPDGSQDQSPLHVDTEKDTLSGLPLPSPVGFGNPLFGEDQDALLG